MESRKEGKISNLRKTSICRYLKILIFGLFFVVAQVSQAQTVSNQDGVTNWFDEITSRIEPYASIRIGVGFDEDGEIGIGNNAPRAGIRFKHALSANKADNFNAVGRVELGFNLVSRDETIEFAVDPGAGIAQVGDAVFSRLGWLGVTYKDFQFTFGKQNSVYYTLGAIEVDKTLAFGGAGIGVWNIADGGVSGTGRANQVMILKYAKNGLSLGAQAQVRNISENNESIDTYGFGANYRIDGFGIGVGYNKVNDGVEDPLPDQAKEGDESFVVSASYEKDRFTVAASYASLNQHQRAGDVFYDATGLEFFGRYRFSKNERWHFALGYNYLKPKEDEDLGDFDTKFFITELAYRFKKSSYISASSRIDQSKDVNGDGRRPSIFGIGIRFDF
ncbi:porin [Flagellimonas allohymeniacidonis]|uniref:Porin n=1 Tax=Flagellimonas allohymeniacidonis TaxID=2517819 RepID=A0A4Q8QGR7_9FLAO|nr:porin [Allomuricauda hymeniacidonis]TAI47316.1 porin [Allomuricauda hymeniacidonis]